MNEVVKNGIKYVRNEVYPYGWIISEVLECKSNTLVIPAQIGTEYVTTIREDCFRNLNQLSSIYLPDSIFDVGNNAFRQCMELKEVIFYETAYAAKGRIILRENTFAACFSLERVVFEREFFLLGACVFANCGKLTQVGNNNDTAIISERLPDGAFHYCKSLKKIVIRGLKFEFYRDSIVGCADLQEIVIYPTHMYKKLPKTLLPTLKNIKIICCENNPLTQLAYDGYNIQILEEAQHGND